MDLPATSTYRARLCIIYFENGEGVIHVQNNLPETLESGYMYSITLRFRNRYLVCCWGQNFIINNVWSKVMDFIFLAINLVFDL